MASLGSVSFTSAQDPELQAIERRRRLAEMLAQQAGEPTQVQQNAPISPLSGLAKALRGYTAGRGMRKADEAEKDYSLSYQKELANVLGGGTSASTNPQIQMLAAQIRMQKEQQAADAAGKQVTNLTDEEEKAAGLNPAGVYQRNAYGKITPLWEPPKPDTKSDALIQQEKDLYAYKAQQDAANRQPDQPKPVGVINLKMPDGTVKAFNSTDEAGINAALSSGGVEQGQERPAASQNLSGKERQTANAKIQAAKLLKQQIAEARTKFDEIKGSFAAGPSGYLLPLSEKGQNFDASIDALRSSVSALTRVPGVGAMSDYETRLDQSKIPQRGRYESTTEQQLKQLEDMANFIESGYSDMLGPELGAEKPTEKKRIKLDSNGNVIP